MRGKNEFHFLPLSLPPCRLQQRRTRKISESEASSSLVRRRLALRRSVRSHSVGRSALAQSTKRRSLPGKGRRVARFPIWAKSPCCARRTDAAVLRAPYSGHQRHFSVSFRAPIGSRAFEFHPPFNFRFSSFRKAITCHFPPLAILSGKSSHRLDWMAKDRRRMKKGHFVAPR